MILAKVNTSKPKQEIKAPKKILENIDCCIQSPRNTQKRDCVKSSAPNWPTRVVPVSRMAITSPLQALTNRPA
jgi:hypothetical protein